MTRDEAAAQLRAGERLLHDRGSGTWSLLSSGETVTPQDAHALLADGALALAPAGDQLPGFPAACAQTWSCRRRRRRTGTAETLAAAPAPARAP